MKTNLCAPPAHLSDRELIDRVRQLSLSESRVTADLVAHLAELDERKLYLEEGYSSLFSYCVEALHLAEHAAFNRIEAARAAQRFPLVLERLADGSVHLAAVRLLAPHLTGENHRHWLDEARHRSKRQVEELVARLRPLPDVAPLIRKLPVPRAGRMMRAAELESARQPRRQSPTNSTFIAPLAPERYKVQFTADTTTRELIRRAQELLGHSIPDGDLSAVMEKALALLVEHLEKLKVARVQKPRSEPATPVTASISSRHIPAGVRRAVWQRDGQRCAYVSGFGHRCNQRARLEFHHVEPYARGGPSTAENIQLRCRQHNRLEADIEFRPWTARRERMSTRPGAS